MMLAKKPSKDPRNLAYLYPSMSLRRYKDLTDDYYRSTCLYTVSRVAEQAGFLIVPCGLLHWRRKKSFAERYFELFGKGYYTLRPDELTPNERRNYEILSGGAEYGRSLEG